MNIFDKRPYKLTKHGYSKGKVHPLIYDAAKSYDDHGYISTGLANELKKLYEDEDYEISIHRTGYTKVTNDFILEVFNNGLINNGDAMQGVINYHTNERTKTLTPINNIMLLIGQIKAACNYKDSDGVFVVKIPKAYVTDDSGYAKPIYFYDDYEQRLLPEYIYGFIPVKNEVVGDIIRNPKYSDIHTYAHDGLLYEPDAEAKAGHMKR